jgi:hypothetical protein
MGDAGDVEDQAVGRIRRDERAPALRPAHQLQEHRGIPVRLVAARGEMGHPGAGIGQALAGPQAARQRGRATGGEPQAAGARLHQHQRLARRYLRGVPDQPFDRKLRKPERNDASHGTTPRTIHRAGRRGSARAAGSRPEPGGLVVEGRRGGRGCRDAPAGARRRAALGRGGEEEEAGRLALVRRQHEAADRGEIQIRADIGDDTGEGCGLQRLLDRPQDRVGLAQRGGEEPVAREAQRLQPMAVNPAPFPRFRRQPAPQEGPCVRRLGRQPPHRKRCGKAQGGRHVAVGGGRDLVHAVRRQASPGQVAVDLGDAEAPALRRHRHRTFDGQARGRLLSPSFNSGDARPQTLQQQAAGAPARGSGGGSARVRRCMCCILFGSWLPLVLYLFYHASKPSQLKGLRLDPRRGSLRPSACICSNHDRSCRFFAAPSL